MITTIEIYSADLPVWRKWCKAKSMNSKTLFNSFIQHVRMKKQQEFYLSLPSPVLKVKALSGEKINKNYRKK